MVSNERHRLLVKTLAPEIPNSRTTLVAYLWVFLLSLSQWLPVNVSFAEELPAVQMMESGGYGESIERVTIDSFSQPTSHSHSSPAPVQDTSSLAAEMLFASSVQLSMSANSIEQRAGDILFKQYVDTYGGSHQGHFSVKEAAVGTPDILSGVQSLLSKAGVDVKQLKNKILRQDWSGVEESLQEARETKALDRDEQESLSQKIAMRFKRDIFSLPGQRNEEINSEALGEQSQGGRRQGSQVTQEQIDRVAYEEAPKKESSASADATSGATRSLDPAPQWDSLALENMGIQKLSKGINIFRLAHYRLSHTNLQRKARRR